MMEETKVSRKITSEISNVQTDTTPEVRIEPALFGIVRQHHPMVALEVTSVNTKQKTKMVMKCQFNSTRIK